MSYSRRNFLKAASAGTVLTTVGAESALVLTAATVARTSPVTTERATFYINGKPHQTSYEARTTLFEVISMKLGLTGTNRSCNRASCGACTVLVNGTPVYSCHTLATEAADRKIVTIEGIGDAWRLHPLQSIGHVRVAADCGFCTAGWVVTAKALLDHNRNPTEADVKAALAGHICRCSAYPNIIRTVLDAAAVLRGESPDLAPAADSILQIKMPMVRDYSTFGSHLPGAAVKGAALKWQGYPPENLNVIGKLLPPMPEVSLPRFTGKAQYASRVWFAGVRHEREPKEDSLFLARLTVRI